MTGEAQDGDRSQADAVLRVLQEASVLMVLEEAESHSGVFYVLTLHPSPMELYRF